MVGVDEFPFGMMAYFQGRTAVSFREGKVNVQAMIVYDKRGMNVSRWWFHCFPKKLGKMTSLRRFFFVLPTGGKKPPQTKILQWCVTTKIQLTINDCLMVFCTVLMGLPYSSYTWQFCERDLFGMVSSRDPFRW